MLKLDLTIKTIVIFSATETNYRAFLVDGFNEIVGNASPPHYTPGCHIRIGLHHALRDKVKKFAKCFWAPNSFRGGQWRN